MAGVERAGGLSHGDPMGCSWSLVQQSITDARDSHRDTRSLSQGYTASGFQPRFAFRDHHLLLLIVSIKLGNNPITHIR